MKRQKIVPTPVADSPVVRGYQADLGDNWWGCLYDEARRGKVLAGPPEDKRTEPLRPGEWNDYRIRCEGKRIQLWINNVATVDYTERAPDIDRKASSPSKSTPANRWKPGTATFGFRSCE
jgi:hypothetical protein